MSNIDYNLTVEDNIQRIEDAIAADISNEEVYNEAIRDFSRLLSKEPFNELLYRHRGHRYLSTSKSEQACADLIMSTRMAPDYWKNWDLLGMAFYYYGDFEQSIAYYDQGLKVTGFDSKFTAPLINWKYLCMCQMGLKDTQEAQDVLHTIKPDNDIAHGIYKDLLMLHQGIINESDIAAKFTPDMKEMLYPTYGYGLASYYYFNGEKEKAEKTFDEILKNSKAWYSWGHKACAVDRQRWFNN